MQKSNHDKTRLKKDSEVFIVSLNTVSSNQNLICLADRFRLISGEQEQETGWSMGCSTSTKNNKKLVYHFCGPSLLSDSLTYPCWKAFKNDQ